MKRTATVRLCSLAIVFAWNAIPLIAVEPKPEAPAIETAWRNLEKNEPESTQALLQLSRDPVATLAVFRAHLKPLNLTGDRLKELIVKLSSDDEKTWQAAFEELEYFDPRLALDLPTLMDVVQAAPVRQRLVTILSGRPAANVIAGDIELRKVGDDGYNFSAGGSWWAEHKIERLTSEFGWGNPKRKWTRAIRAIVLLEHFGTPEAQAILEDLAKGHAEAQPTKVAKQALERLNATEPKP